MRLRAAIVAQYAVSPLGVGEDAVDPGRVGEPACVAIARDPEMVALGFLRPSCARAPQAVFADAAPDADPAQLLLDRAMTGLLAALGGSESLRGLRVGFVLGTSSGGMRVAERLFAARARGEVSSAEVARAATYFAPFEAARAALKMQGIDVARSLQIVTACAASTWALGVGLRWLERGAADLVIAGGYDAFGPFVAAGFECLRATTATLPAPFRIGRDGMSLGEGAGLVALMREGDTRGAPRVFVSGFGASTDAVHITAPDRTGGGLFRAGEGALRDAAIDRAAIGAISAHATATPYNDAMESKAIHELFGPAASALPVHPFKAQIGHTLGAAGVLESLALARALEDRVAPAAVCRGAADPEAPACLLVHAAPLAADAGLKLSAAFGGANAALVLERADTAARPTPRARHRVFLHGASRAIAADAAKVAARSGAEPDKIARVDAYSLLLATAVAGLEPGPPRGAGLIVGHGLATIDINERFYARVLAKGPTAAEPRLFPPTSPNLMPGQVAIFFGLTGPSAAVASGPGGALDPVALAWELVASGDCDVVLAGAVDVVGPASRYVADAAFGGAPDLVDGACVAVLSRSAEGAVRELVAPPEPAAANFREAFGHLALARWLGLV